MQQLATFSTSQYNKWPSSDRPPEPILLPRPCPVAPAEIVTAPAPPATSPVSNALRNIVLGAFLLYCLLPAFWIITAMSKDNGMIVLDLRFVVRQPSAFF